MTVKIIPTHKHRTSLPRWIEIPRTSSAYPICLFHVPSSSRSPLPFLKAKKKLTPPQKLHQNSFFNLLFELFKRNKSGFISIGLFLQSHECSQICPSLDSLHFLASSASLSVTMDVPATTVTTDDAQKNDYSVWAVPPEDVIPRIKKLMECLRSEFGGPQFEPHMTVVGLVSLTQDDALAKFKAACDGLKAYNCTVDSVATGTFFYQCVYLLIHPTTEVVEASAKSSSIFGFKSATPYMPHISLLYGDLTDEEKKKAQEGAYSLDESIGQLSFPVTRLQLWKTPTSDNTLTSWEKIAEYNLSPN